MIMTREKRICDKCGSSNFDINFYTQYIDNEMPFVDMVTYCKDCGEMHKEDRDRYSIITANFHTGIVKLKQLQQD